MAKLTLQQVSSILGKSAITKLNPASAVATTGIQAGKAVSKELFGYDFVGLLIKIVVFFAVSYLAEIFIRGKIALDEVIRNPDTPVAVASGFFGLGGIIFNYLYKSYTGGEYDPNLDPNKFKPKEGEPSYDPSDPYGKKLGLNNFWSNEKVKQLFSEQGFHGLNYWSIIKIITILLVIAEFSQYLKMNKALGAKGSPMTVGIFTLIIIALGLTTIPELIQRVKGTDFNLEALR